MTDRRVPRPKNNIWELAAMGVLTEKDVTSSGQIRQVSPKNDIDELIEIYEARLRCMTEMDEDRRSTCMSSPLLNNDMSEALYEIRRRLDRIEQLLQLLLSGV